jgi:hypothetical protein
LRVVLVLVALGSNHLMSRQQVQPRTACSCWKHLQEEQQGTGKGVKLAFCQ